jgi:hypothetical protein
MVGLVPEMGRCPGSEKRRGRGEGTGAEDGNTGAKRVRRDAAHGQAVARLGAMLIARGVVVESVVEAWCAGEHQASQTPSRLCRSGGGLNPRAALDGARRRREATPEGRLSLGVQFVSP